MPATKLITPYERELIRSKNDSQGSKPAEEKIGELLKNVGEIFAKAKGKLDKLVQGSTHQRKVVTHVAKGTYVVFTDEGKIKCIDDGVRCRGRKVLGGTLAVDMPKGGKVYPKGTYVEFTESGKIHCADDECKR